MRWLKSLCSISPASLTLGTICVVVGLFVYGVPILLGSTVGALLYTIFLAWVCYAISFLVRKGHVNIPRAVISFIAGISLLDALLIAGREAPEAAGLATVGFGLTLLFQRYVRGT